MFQRCVLMALAVAIAYVAALDQDVTAQSSRRAAESTTSSPKPTASGSAPVNEQSPDDEVVRARIKALAAERERPLKNDLKDADQFRRKYLFTGAAIRKGPAYATRERMRELDAVEAAAGAGYAALVQENELFRSLAINKQPYRRLTEVLIGKAMVTQGRIAMLPVKERRLNAPRQGEFPVVDISVYKEALLHESYGLHQLMVTLNGVLAAMGHGGPAEYQKEYASMLSAARRSAEQRQKRLQAAQDAFSEMLGAGLVGITGLAIMSGQKFTCDAAMAEKHRLEQINKKASCEALPRSGIWAPNACPFDGACMPGY